MAKEKQLTLFDAGEPSNELPVEVTPELPERGPSPAAVSQLATPQPNTEPKPEVTTPDGGTGIPFGVALLGLGSLKGLGQKGMNALVTQYGDGLGALYKLIEAEIAEVLRACDISGADKFAAAISQDPKALLGKGADELARLADRKTTVVAPSQLPNRLKALGRSAPRWLFVEGNVAALSDGPMVAVVGTRTPSENGMEATRIVANIISTYPVVMVSGLAEGIDCRAHWVSLENNVTNVAFLGHGINHIFPESTAEIRREIVRRGGAVVSEYLPAQHFQKRLFVERNRLQAALAHLVIPVEAKATSGTAHTINFARTYSRPLVGMVWDGANGIVDDLRAHDDKLIEIFTSAGRREFDALVQGVLVHEQADCYPFKNLERLVLREFRNRTYTQENVSQLIEAIEREAPGKKP